MKLFDLNKQQKRQIKNLLLWHGAYLLLISLFFTFIYFFNYFKNHPILRENTLFMLVSPLSTIVFVILSPWRGHWRRAVTETIARLEGEPIFCLMGAVVMAIGFFFYSVLLWGLGALLPSLFYM